MKTVGLIPFWFNNGKSREIKKLAGKHLIEYTISLLNTSSLIDETIIYASENKILNYINPELNVSFLERPKSLDSNNASIEDIIESFFNKYKAHTIVLLHPYTPFLTKETLNQCIEEVKNNSHDSAFTAIKSKKFTWYKNEPLNFDMNKKSPKLKDLEPTIMEQGLLYVLPKATFLEHKSRIGKNPYMHFISHFEGHEVNEAKDFEIAELIVNSGLFKGV